MHFFTPPYAKIGWPAYYHRSAKLSTTTTHENDRVAPEGDTLSDVPEVNEEIRAVALRFLLLVRGPESVRVTRPTLKVGIHCIANTCIEINWQDRKRKREGTEEAEPSTTEFAGDMMLVTPRCALRLSPKFANEKPRPQVEQTHHSPLGHPVAMFKSLFGCRISAGFGRLGRAVNTNSHSTYKISRAI